MRIILSVRYEVIVFLQDFVRLLGQYVSLYKNIPLRYGK